MAASAGKRRTGERIAATRESERYHAHTTRHIVPEGEAEARGDDAVAVKERREEMFEKTCCEVYVKEGAGRMTTADGARERGRDSAAASATEKVKGVPRQRGKVRRGRRVAQSHQAV